MKDIDNNSSGNNNLKKPESFEQEDYQNIIINKSNKTLVFMIKIFFMILIILIFAIIIFISYKFKYILSFNQRFNRYYHDLTVLTYRYSIIYYYYNTLRILIVLPDSSTTKIRYLNAMENINEIYEIENKKYIDILSSNIGDYKEVNKLFNIYKETKGDNFDEIKQIVCNKFEFCEMFMESNKNLLCSGIDFAFKTIVTEISNLYMDYKKIKNKENIEEIKSSLFFQENSKFNNIGQNLNYFFSFVTQNIFTHFEKDEIDLNISYINMMNFLNLFSIAISILIFLFIVFFIFIYISKFSEPIKDATFRVNCSFFHIKKYSLTIYRKFGSNNVK
jgi:hypothetical protein